MIEKNYYKNEHWYKVRIRPNIQACATRKCNGAYLYRSTRLNGTAPCTSFPAELVLCSPTSPRSPRPRPAAPGLAPSPPASPRAPWLSRLRPALQPLSLVVRGSGQRSVLSFTSRFVYSVSAASFTACVSLIRVRLNIIVS